MVSTKVEFRGYIEVEIKVGVGTLELNLGLHIGVWIRVGASFGGSVRKEQTA